MRLATHIILILISCSLQVNALCYFPDGKTVPLYDVPCRTDTKFSACCGQGYACLSNNMCMLTSHVLHPIEGQTKYLRGSCTDQFWNSDACPHFCTTPSNGDNPARGTFIDKCPDPNTQRYYCLNKQTVPPVDKIPISEICAKSEYFFELSNGIGDTTRRQSTKADINAEAPSTITIIGVSAPAATSTEISSPNQPSTTQEIIPSPLVQPSPSTPVAASTPSTIVVAKEERSEQLYIGIIVPLGVIALLVSGFAFFRYCSSKKEVLVRAPLCERHCSYLGDPAVAGQPQNLALDPQGYGPSGLAHELSTRPNTMYYPRGQGNYRYSYVVAPAQQQEPRADTDVAT